MMRTLLRWTAAAGIIAVATLLLLELMVRTVMPQQEPQLWLQPDARYGHVMKANFHQRVRFPGTDFVMEVRTNALGFRDAEPAPREEGVPAIVFAGDSFTFGHGVHVEDRFDTVATGLLRAHGQRVRGINIGVSAWGTVQQTRYLADHLSELQPDVIVLTFCENDPRDDVYFLSTGVSFDRVRFPGKDLLRAHSHLFRLLQHLYLVARKTLLAPAGAAAAPEPATPSPPATPQPPAELPEWPHTEEALRAFMDLWRQQKPGARLIVQSTLPWDEAMSSRLREIASRIPGVEYLDLAPEAARIPEGERRLPYDGHWSAAMHRVSGEAIARALQPSTE
jgi:hypothetical protein